MRLTEKHINIVTDYLTSNSYVESYTKYMGNHGKPESDRVAAANFFKKPDVAAYLTKLIEIRDKAVIKAVEKTYERITSEHIATELELDVMHTRIIRGQIEVEEIFPVKVKKVVKKGHKPVYAEVTEFRREKRRPSIAEVQRSINALYLRKGSLKQLKVDTNQDDQQAAEASKGNQQAERFFVLSDGSKIPMAE